jgi:hypothetical protein
MVSAWSWLHAVTGKHIPSVGCACEAVPRANSKSASCCGARDSGSWLHRGDVAVGVWHTTHNLRDALQATLTRTLDTKAK